MPFWRISNQITQHLKRKLGKFHVRFQNYNWSCGFNLGIIQIDNSEEHLLDCLLEDLGLLQEISSHLHGFF